MEEEGAVEPISSSQFAVEEMAVQSGQVKCLELLCLWGPGLSVGIIHPHTPIRLAYST